MSIPYAMDYTASVSGAVYKFVPCQHCKAEYVYLMERTGTGGGTSFLFLDNQGASNRASSQAEQELVRKLSQGIDMVPCPSCFHYQTDMVLKARKKYHRWMIHLGVFSLCGILPAGFFWLIFSQVLKEYDDANMCIILGLMAFLLGLGLLVTRTVLLKNYNPNDPKKIDARQKVASQRAMLKTEFEATHQEVSEAMKKHAEEKQTPKG